MSVDNLRYSGEIKGNILDASVLTIAAATELSSPLVLMRQLGFSLQNENLSATERQRLIEQLTLTSERALRLTTSLSMSVYDQVMLPLEPINPVTVCQEVIRELSPLFSAYGKKITLQTRMRIPLSVGNRAILQQVLAGFGDNALHYGSAEHPIQMTVSGTKDMVRVGVRDYGPAVPIDVWERLEDKLAKKARAPLATRPQASAVTLLTVKRLADLMGSAVGTVRHRDGATFYIDLRLSNQMSLL